MLARPGPERVARLVRVAGGADRPLAQLDALALGGRGDAHEGGVQRVGLDPEVLFEKPDKGVVRPAVTGRSRSPAPFLRLAGGGTVAELKMLARKFEPADVGRIRLSRDEKLRAAVEDLERRFWAQEWKGMGGHSDRDVALKLVEAARRNGRPVEGGVRVERSWGTLELESKVSRRTLSKAIRRLEIRGFLRRDNEGRREGKSGAFILRASVNHYGGGTAGGGDSDGPTLGSVSPAAK